MYTDKQRFLTAEQLSALAVAAVIGIGFLGIAAHRDKTKSEQPLATHEPRPVERHFGLHTPDPH